MTIRVGILEDEPTSAAVYRRMITAWSRKNRPCSVSVFPHGESLCQRIFKNEHFDILFLDIHVRNERDGVHVAYELKEHGYTGSIVFISAFDSFWTACEAFWKAGYDVDACQYFFKPLTDQDLAQCLHTIPEQPVGNRLHVSARGSQYKIPFYDILYFSTQDHTTTIHTTNGLIAAKKPLHSFIPELPAYFRRCHRSFIVNLYYIYRFAGSTLLLDNGEHIHVSKAQLPCIRQEFLQLSGVL